MGSFTVRDLYGFLQEFLLRFFYGAHGRYTIKDSGLLGALLKAWSRGDSGDFPSLWLHHLEVQSKPYTR